MATKPQDFRAILPLPRGGGEGWGEGESLPSQWVFAYPLTLALSPSEGVRESVSGAGRPSCELLNRNYSVGIQSKDAKTQRR